ncbi:unnamed protein product [Prorocentrum cordatum]|uniref:Uncharacterized protein n=1 Tax=Prorocentrum cordatum TaxID=2364126 RepID=A0ABN9Q6W3_9DINO|nr:unnamed protein product [Polarella glacialis]
MRQVVQFVSEELSPLQPFLEDARHNAEVMAAVDRRHCRFAKALPAERWSSKWHPAAAGPPQEAPAAQGSTARRSPRVGPEEPAQPLQPEHREHRASLLRRSRANDASLLVLDDAEPPAAGRVPSPERERAAPPQQAPRFDPTRCIAITKWGVQCENKPKRNLCEEQDWEYCGRHTSYSRGGDTVHPNCPHGDMNDVVPAASPAPAREEMRELNRTELGTIRQFTGTGVIVAERIGGEQKTFETKHSDEDEAYMQAQMFLQHVAHVVDGAPAASSGDAPARQPRAAAALLAEAGSSPAGAAAAPAAPARPSEASAEPAVRSRAAAAPAAQRSAPAAEARGRGAAAAAAEAAGGAGGAPGGLPRPEREAASRAGFTGPPWWSERALEGRTGTRALRPFEAMMEQTGPEGRTGTEVLLTVLALHGALHAVSEQMGPEGRKGID